MALVTMQTLVGLFLFYALLTTGASLECESSLLKGNSYIASQMVTCATSDEICMTVTFDGVIGDYTGVKSCFSKDLCEKLKTEKEYTGLGGTVKIKEVTCKAPSPSASLLLALAGFLLLKVIV